MRSMALAWRSAVFTCALLILGCDSSDKSLVGTGDSIRAAEVAAVPHLAFTVQPDTTTAGATIPAVLVTAQDAQGNTVTTFKGNITVAFGANPAGGVLAGDKMKKAVSGVATFATLIIKKAGAGYTLVASAVGFDSSTSATFDINPALASKLLFTVPPASTAAGDTISPPVQVSALDPYGNTATTFNGDIALTLRSCGTGSVLWGTVTAPAINGVATFGDLSVNKSGNCGLKATSGSFSATSSFLVGPAAPTHLVVFTKVLNTVAGTTLGPISVVAKDRFDNTASGFNGPVTMAIDSGPVGATLSGTTTVTAGSGTAVFSTLVLQKIGPYVLLATADSLTGATSNGFLIKANSPTHLAFTVQPHDTVPGAIIAPPIEVTVRDAYDNPVKINGSVTLAIGSNPGGGTLLGTTTKSASTGIATFGNLRINNAGTGYTLVATLGNLPSATSAPFNIGSGNPPTQLTFTAQPSNAASGDAIAPPVQVTARDALGNTVSSFTGNVTVSIGTNPSGGTLSGTLTVAAVSGVATFSDLSINTAGNGYTLQASSAGLATTTSVAFDITAGAAAQLVFTVQPTNTSAGATITPAVQVTAADAQGNTVNSFNGNVTVSIGTNPSGGTLSGTLTVVAGSGVVSFSNLTIDNAGNGYTLQASAAGLTTATSVAFNVTSLSDSWTTRASMPTARNGLAVAAIGGILYAVGGTGGGAEATLEAYDPATDIWTTLAPMPTPRAHLGAVAINGILYAVGGVDNTNTPLPTLEAYDPATDSWTTLAPMSTARAYVGVTAINGTLYAVGGYNRLDVVEAYDPATDTWTPRAPLPTGRAAAGVVAINGTLYAVGGLTFNNVATLDAYDPATDTWNAKTPMPTARYVLGAVAINGTLYAVGGAGAQSAVVGALETYDPATDSWTAKTPMPTARGGLGAAAINGILYVVGGYGPGPLATLEAYHP